MLSGLQNPEIEASVLCAPAGGDLVQALPVELVQTCFRLLDFRARVYVSHVSRAWRAVELNDCFLWNEAPAPHTSSSSGTEMLCTLLARSDPLPFSFSWSSPFPGVWLPIDMADVGCSNMHRMETLCIKDLAIDSRERLFRLPAPRLRTFRSQDTKGSPVLAELWPILEELRIVSLVFLSKPQQFAAVRIFCCWDIDRFGDANISLFSVFPALKTLRVRHIMEEDFACLSDPPASMDELSLGVMGAFEVDYAPLLRVFLGHGVNRLRLSMAREAAGAVELFTSTANGPWHLDMEEHNAGMRAEMRDEAQDRTWIVTCDARISFAREPRLAACMSRLQAFTSSIALLFELHNLDGWSRSLPALRTLTLQILQHGNPSGNISVPRSTTPIRMPVLSSLTLWLDSAMMGEINHLIETRLPALLPAILERVPQVTIEVLDLVDVFENACLFMRDALGLRTFTLLVKSGRSGHLILALKWLILQFKAGGHPKYAREMMHVVHNLQEVWPKPLRDLILQNWLVNPTGTTDGFVALDLMQEHLNFWIKKIYAAHGSNASWDWLKTISPCIGALRKLTNQVHAILGHYQGGNTSRPASNTTSRLL